MDARKCDVSVLNKNESDVESFLRFSSNNLSDRCSLPSQIEVIDQTFLSAGTSYDDSQPLSEKLKSCADVSIMFPIFDHSIRKRVSDSHKGEKRDTTISDFSMSSECSSTLNNSPIKINIFKKPTKMRGGVNDRRVSLKVNSILDSSLETSLSIDTSLANLHVFKKSHKPRASLKLDSILNNSDSDINNDKTISDTDSLVLKTDLSVGDENLVKYNKNAYIFAKPKKSRYSIKLDSMGSIFHDATPSDESNSNLEIHDINSTSIRSDTETDGVDIQDISNVDGLDIQNVLNVDGVAQNAEEEQVEQRHFYKSNLGFSAVQSDIERLDMSTPYDATPETEKLDEIESRYSDKLHSADNSNVPIEKEIESNNKLISCHEPTTPRDESNSNLDTHNINNTSIRIDTETNGVDIQDISNVVSSTQCSVLPNISKQSDSVDNLPHVKIVEQMELTVSSTRCSVLPNISKQSDSVNNLPHVKIVEQMEITEQELSAASENLPSAGDNTDDSIRIDTETNGVDIQDISNVDGLDIQNVLNVDGLAHNAKEEQVERHFDESNLGFSAVQSDIERLDMSKLYDATPETEKLDEIESRYSDKLHSADNSNIAVEKEIESNNKLISCHESQSHIGISNSQRESMNNLTMTNTSENNEELLTNNDNLKVNDDKHIGGKVNNTTFTIGSCNVANQDNENKSVNEKNDDATFVINGNQKSTHDSSDEEKVIASEANETLNIPENVVSSTRCSVLPNISKQTDSVENLPHVKIVEQMELTVSSTRCSVLPNISKQSDSVNNLPHVKIVEKMEMTEQELGAASKNLPSAGDNTDDSKLSSSLKGEENSSEGVLASEVGNVTLSLVQETEERLASLSVAREKNISSCEHVVLSGVDKMLKEQSNEGRVSMAASDKSEEKNFVANENKQLAPFCADANIISTEKDKEELKSSFVDAHLVSRTNSNKQSINSIPDISIDMTMIPRDSSEARPEQLRGKFHSTPMSKRIDKSSCTETKKLRSSRINRDNANTLVSNVTNSSKSEGKVLVSTSVQVHSISLNTSNLDSGDKHLSVHNISKNRRSARLNKSGPQSPCEKKKIIKSKLYDITNELPSVKPKKKKSVTFNQKLEEAESELRDKTYNSHEKTVANKTVMGPPSSVSCYSKTIKSRNSIGTNHQTVDNYFNPLELSSIRDNMVQSDECKKDQVHHSTPYPKNKSKAPPNNLITNVLTNKSTQMSRNLTTLSCEDSSASSVVNVCDTEKNKSLNEETPKMVHYSERRRNVSENSTVKENDLGTDYDQQSNNSSRITLHSKLASRRNLYSPDSLGNADPSNTISELIPSRSSNVTKSDIHSIKENVHARISNTWSSGLADVESMFSDCDRMSEPKSMYNSNSTIVRSELEYGGESCSYQQDTCGPEEDRFLQDLSAQNYSDRVSEISVTNCESDNLFEQRSPDILLSGAKRNKRPRKDDMLTTAQAKIKKGKTSNFDPEQTIDGVPYKTPKMFKPAPWIRKKLYAHLEYVMESTWGIETRMRSEQFVAFLVCHVSHALMIDEGYEIPVEIVKRKLFELNICENNLSYYTFLYRHTPKAYNKKALPFISHLPHFM